MQIAGTSNAASAYASSSSARSGTAVSAPKSGSPSGGSVPQPVDQFAPGTRHRPKKGKGNYKKPKVRRPPAPKLSPEQLQARQAMQKRLDQQRMASAMGKSELFEPGAATPLPPYEAMARQAAENSKLPVPEPIVPEVPSAIETAALPETAPVAATEALETTAEAAAQEQLTVNVGPGQMDITAQMLDKPSPESSGILGTALGVGLAASTLTAYIARDSLNPLVGAQIIGQAAIDAAPGALDAALWAAPKVVDGALWLGPQIVNAAPAVVDGALWLGPALVEGTTDFIANAPGYLQTGINGLQTAQEATVDAAYITAEALVDAGQVTAEAVVDATPVVIQGAKDFATFVQNFEFPTAAAPAEGGSSPFSLENIAADPGAAIAAAVENPAAAGEAIAEVLAGNEQAAAAAEQLGIPLPGVLL